MSNPRVLELTYNGTGATLYGIIRRMSDGKVWNGTSLATWSNGGIASCAIALVDRGGDFYSVDVPSALPAGDYKVTYYLQAGGTPAITDTFLDSDNVTYSAYEAAATTTPGGINTLDAVNRMLEAIGLPAVTALDTGGTSEEAEAEVTLDRVNKRIQSAGWACNTIKSKTYTPDGSDNIVLTGILKVEAVGDSSTLQVAIRDGMLYDMENDTDEFDDDVELSVVTLVPFDDLSTAMAEYIVCVARVEFQRFKKRGQVDDAMAQQETLAARVHAMQEDGDLRKANVLTTAESLRLKGNRNTTFVDQLGAS